MKKIRAGIWLILVSVVVLGLSVAPSQAAVIFTDNFDGESLGLNYTGFANWTVSDGTVDLIGTGFFDFYPGNGFYVDLDGSTGDAGKMTSSNISFASGDYVLSFYLGGSRRGDTNSVNVSVEVGLLAINTFTLGPLDPLQLYTLPFSVSSPTIANIIFNHSGGDSLGIILDRVSLDSVSDGTAVPEPSTMLLLGSGLVGLVGYGRRKFKK